MLVAAGVAFYRGWKIHTEREALVAFGLGTLALGLGVWHLAGPQLGTRMGKRSRYTKNG
jgi:hypothetical protein